MQSCGINIELELDADYLIFCPIHSNFRTPAAEVDKNTGRLHCFGCQQTKSFTELVMHCTGRTFFEAVRLIESKRADSDILSDISKMISKPKEFEEFDTELIKSLHENLMSASGTEAVQYLKMRGINKDSAIKYCIGYSIKQKMVTIPVYSPDNICLGFVGRSIEGKVFKNSTGLPKSKTLFNINRNKISNQIFVTESSFDAIRIEQAGRSAVATLGATVSNRQIDLLKQYFNSIILLPDNDEAGRSMARKMQESLGSIVTIGNIPEEYKDISDMNEEQIQSLIYRFDNIIEYIIN